MYKPYVYTLARGNIQWTCTLKTAKITKGNIARITLTMCQCAAE